MGLAVNDYKVYVYNGSSYTDISSINLSNSKIPELEINSDGTPILKSMIVETFADLSSTTLQDGYKIIYTVEYSGTEQVIWIGYIESSAYDYNSRRYKYNILHIFEVLKGTIASPLTTTDLYNTGFNELTSATEYNTQTSSIYSGASPIIWKDVQIRGIFKQVFEDSDIIGNLVLSFNYSNLTTNMTTIFENYCVSDLCLRYLGTDFSDEDIVAGTEDLVSIWDMIKELFKVLGIKYKFGYTYGLTPTIYFYNSDTAPTVQTFEDEDINKYTESFKKLNVQKSFDLKQNIINIEDTALLDNTHRYFTPVIYGFPSNRIGNIKQSTINSDNLEILTNLAHKYPATDNTKIKTIKFVDILNNNSFEIGGDWSYLSTNVITLYNKTIENTRFTRTNLGSSYSISSLVHTANTDTVTITISDTSTLSPNGIVITGFYKAGDASWVNSSYTYEAGIGDPTTNDAYRIQNATTIIIKRGLADFTQNYIEAYTITNTGTLTESAGTAGDPNYITFIKDFATGGTPANVKRVYCNLGHGIASGSGDTLYIFNTGDSDYDGKSWTEQTNLTLLSAGEYYVYNTLYLYLYDSGESDYDYARIRTIFPKYEHKVNILEKNNSDTQSISIMDYLVIYRPSYASSGWEQDWYTIDMEDTTNNLLLNQSLLATELTDFWWLYYYSQFYQKIIRYAINEDNEATTLPTLLASKIITHNVKDRSIDITQEGI